MSDHPDYLPIRKRLTEAFNHLANKDIITEHAFLCCKTCSDKRMKGRVKNHSGAIFYSQTEDKCFKEDGYLVLYMAKGQKGYSELVMICMKALEDAGLLCVHQREGKFNQIIVTGIRPAANSRGSYIEL